MAWTTPKTDRTAPEPKTTATDMNRIGGNLNYITGGTFKANYTSNDIVLQTDWTALIEALRFWNANLTGGTNWADFNEIEQTLKEAHSGSVLPNNSRYPSNTLYPTDE